MVIGCGSKRILCFSRCTLVDQVKSCISFACTLKGLPSGRQALTLTLTLLRLQKAAFKQADSARPHPPSARQSLTFIRKNMITTGEEKKTSVSLAAHFLDRTRFSSTNGSTGQPPGVGHDGGHV